MTPPLAAQWFAPALHSVVEAFGSFSALLLAALCWQLWWSRRELGLGLWMATALVAMGILDGIHAAVPPGPAFVWLHSLAVLAGGLLFMLVWLPNRLASERVGAVLPIGAALAAATAGISVALRPEILPPPVLEGGFAPWAAVANLVGGAGFLAAAVRFARARAFDQHSGVPLIFAVLQGAGGLVFPFSSLWDPLWWGWHLVRLAAFWAAIAYLFLLRRDEALRTLAARQEIEALRRIDALKDRFLTMLSHELRTPLNAILGFGSLLEDEVAGPLNVAQKGYLSKMLAGGNVLLSLISDLLDMSRIQAGQFRLNKRPIDMPEVVREVLGALEPLAHAGDVRLSADLADVPPIEADDQRLSQVLYNLLGNAIKFTPAGGTVRVRLGVNGLMRCEVRDSGPGIAAEDIPKLFKPFSQLAAPGTLRVRGTGLGLSISKALVEAHGGEIGVESEPGRGSTFWFTLPESLIRDDLV